MDFINVKIKRRLRFPPKNAHTSKLPIELLVTSIALSGTPLAYARLGIKERMSAPKIVR